MNRYVYGLISYHNFDSRIITISENIPALEWMRECLPGYDFVPTFNLAQRPDWDISINNENCYLYRFTIPKLYKLSDDIDSKKMNQLCNSWLRSYNTICNWINHQRRYVGAVDNLKQQSLIYQMKLSEAKNIIDGITDGVIFLKNEAILKNISLNQMAEEVILQNEIYKGFLARTEYMRVKWLKILKESNDIDQHENIIKEFQKEMYEYHKLS